MASKCGYVVTKRINDDIWLKTLNDHKYGGFSDSSSQEIKYKIIEKFEFSSDRKRMSVIVEMPRTNPNEEP